MNPKQDYWPSDCSALFGMLKESVTSWTRRGNWSPATQHVRLPLLQCSNAYSPPQSLKDDLRLLVLR